jgi:hypothetical protein
VRIGIFTAMAFRILPNGTIEADTLIEALQARDAVLKKRTRTEKREGEDRDRRWSPKTVSFLMAVWKNPEGLNSREVADKAGLSPKSLPPIIRGLKAFAKKSGIGFDKLIVVESSFEKGRPVTTYKFGETGDKLLVPGLMVLEKNGSGAAAR